MKPKPWSFFVRPSTLSFFREGQRTSDYSLWDSIHGYVYGRWPYLYIGIGTGEHWLARTFGPVIRGFARISAWLNPGNEARQPSNGTNGNPGQRITFADTYHGKVMPLESATELITVGEEIRLTDLEKVIPYARARDIILQNPDQIVALECPCRASRQDPCLPLDVCLIVGEPFAAFVSEHHPHRSRRISVEQAVEILRAEDQRGHVHHAFFKDAMLGRFYAICNCCSCCCGAIQAHRRGTPMLASSGYRSIVDEGLCIGCGECEQFCQFEALTLDGYVAVVNEAACMGCGVCVSKCEQGALALVRDSHKGMPLEIRRLLDHASRPYTQVEKT
ncbi:MAG: 4Fe-4S binding protein [Anaerolineales bacterium]